MCDHEVKKIIGIKVYTDTYYDLLPKTLQGSGVNRFHSGTIEYDDGTIKEIESHNIGADFEFREIDELVEVVLKIANNDLSIDLEIDEEYCDIKKYAGNNENIEDEYMESIDKDKIRNDKFSLSKFYIGENDWIKEMVDAKSEDGMTEKDLKKLKDKIRLFLKKHLELNNVSFLFGTGSSLHLGTTSILSVPKEFEKELETQFPDIYKLFIDLIKEYQKKLKNIDDKDKFEKKDGIIRWKKEPYEIPIQFEQYMDFLLGLEYVSHNSSKVTVGDIEIKNEEITSLINILKKFLFKITDLDVIDILKSKFYSNLKGLDKSQFDKQTDECKNLYYYHKKFIKSLLGRPLNLRRANIFTINYDLAFENTFDSLGVHYIDGFCGFNQRYFKPEVYDFDMYYPGNTTEGKIRRVEKVIKYFKLHGSLTWVKEDEKPNNIYGLREYPIDYIRDLYNEETKNTTPRIKNNEGKIGNMMIYPTSYKKGYTLDFPYSELFRHFSSSITQSQSVLVCVGYSFYDEHINDIIYQALTIPSFTLIIVDYNGTKNASILKLKELNDPRIIIMEGPYLGDFKIFSDEIMPNFHELNTDVEIAKTLNQIYANKNNEGE